MTNVVPFTFTMWAPRSGYCGVSTCVPHSCQTTLLTYCTYVQWVPGSDVVVAQHRDNLCVWYSIDNADQVVTIPINGDVVEIVRRPGSTEVSIDEGSVLGSVSLNEGLIAFGTAMDQKKYHRCLPPEGGCRASQLIRSSAALFRSWSRCRVKHRAPAECGDDWLTKRFAMANLPSPTGFGGTETI